MKAHTVRYFNTYVEIKKHMPWILCMTTEFWTDCLMALSVDFFKRSTKKVKMRELKKNRSAKKLKVIMWDSEY